MEEQKENISAYRKQLEEQAAELGISLVNYVGHEFLADMDPELGDEAEDEDNGRKCTLAELRKFVASLRGLPGDTAVYGASSREYNAGLCIYKKTRWTDKELANMVEYSLLQKERQRETKLDQLRRLKEELGET